MKPTASGSTRSNRRAAWVDVPHMSEFRFTPTGQRRSSAAAETAREKAVKQRWRALALVIKAKLEAVASGIVTFEDEFMAHILLPNGETVSDFMAPQLDSVYATGEMPSLLPPARTALGAGS